MNFVQLSFEFDVEVVFIIEMFVYVYEILLFMHGWNQPWDLAWYTARTGEFNRVLVCKELLSTITLFSF